MLKKSDLHEYQKKVVARAVNENQLALFMAMGTGKTPTMLTVLSEIEGPTLIVAPKAVAINTWRQEAVKWEHTKDMTFSLVMGTPKERDQAIKKKADVYITNYEQLPWLLEQKGLPKWKTLVLDESQRIKNPSSQRWKVLKKSLAGFERRYILTGTPMSNYLDLWTQISALDLGQRLSRSMTIYKEKYFDPDKKDPRRMIVYSWKLKTGAQQQVDALLADICISLRAEDYLELPEKQNVFHNIAWDKSALSVYKALKKDAVAQVEGETFTAATAGVLTNKLLQLTSGEIYNESGDTSVVHSAKIDFLTDLADGSPTLIFYHFKHSLKRLKEAFPEAVVLDPTDTRTIENWRAGKIDMLLCQPKSTGAGLNLQNNTQPVSNVVWFDLTYSSEDYLQSNSRLFRQGQTSKVIIHHLCMQDSIDQKVIDVLENKTSIQDALLKELAL